LDFNEKSLFAPCSCCSVFLCVTAGSERLVLIISVRSFSLGHRWLCSPGNHHGTAIPDFFLFWADVARSSFLLFCLSDGTGSPCGRSARSWILMKSRCLHLVRAVRFSLCVTAGSERLVLIISVRSFSLGHRWLCSPENHHGTAIPDFFLFWADVARSSFLLFCLSHGTGSPCGRSARSLLLSPDLESPVSALFAAQRAKARRVFVS
jgi:hypothetical protein